MPGHRSSPSRVEGQSLVVSTRSDLVSVLGLGLRMVDIWTVLDMCRALARTHRMRTTCSIQIIFATKIPIYMSTLEILRCVTISRLTDKRVKPVKSRMMLVIEMRPPTIHRIRMKACSLNCLPKENQDT